MELQGSCSGCPSSATNDFKTRCSKSFMSLFARGKEEVVAYTIINYEKI